MTVKENKTLGEKIITDTLPSGLKCYIMPKVAYREKMAAVGVHYGSADIAFCKDGQTIRTPKGTAHFIEHKLFEEEWGNVFEEFTKNGANANAFTNANQTVYYFSCMDQFEKNLGLLLDFVQSPYFPEDSAEREKDIIGQEIAMYNDDPSWIAYFNMLKAMYKKHGVRYSIAGSEQSIAKIHERVLYDSYHAFYSPESMSVFCTGDVDEKTCMEHIREHWHSKGRQKAETVEEAEPFEIERQYVEAEMDVARPMFQLGYKCLPSSKEECKQKFCMRIVLDLLFANSSKAFQMLQERDLLFGELGYQFLSGRGYGFVAISGVSNQPKEAADVINQSIWHMQKEGVSEEAFQRVKKKQIGRFIRGFNSLSAITMSQMELALHGDDLLAGFSQLQAVEKKDAEDLLRQEFHPERLVLSVIKRGE